MNLIALTGASYSGKTVLADHLAANGYLKINFTETLKRQAKIALAACGVVVDEEDINRNKGSYRGLLQELGTHLGFDSDPLWVEEALARWEDLGRPAAVFDNARTDAQAATLLRLGFRVVKVQVRPEIRALRAWSAGVTEEMLDVASHHPVEQGLTENLIEYTVSGEAPPDRTLRLLQGLADAA